MPVMQNTSPEDKESSRFVRLLTKIAGSLPLDPDERRRGILAAFFLLTMMFFTLGFSVYHFYKGHYSIVAWDFLGFFLCLFILLYLRKKGKTNVVDWLEGSGVILFGSVTTIIGRTEFSIFFWAFVLPIALFALAEKKKGLVLSLLFLCITIFLMTAPEHMMNSAPYASSFIVRFIIIYIIITAATYNYESSHKMMISDIKRQEEKYRNILENMQEGYFEVDLAGNFTFFNDSLCRVHGYPREELMGMNNRQYTDEETAKKLFQAFNRVYKTREPLPEIDFQVKTKDGNKRYIDASISLLEDSSGKPTGFRGVIRDITERKLAEERIQYLATHDTLTELPNRMMFGQMLNQAIKSAKRHQRQFAVLFIDLDRFKIINDSMGHDAGDQLLKEMANRLRQSLRAVDVVGRPKERDDIVGRLGGDEFVILIEEVSELNQVATVAQKVLSTIMKPMVLLGEECRVTTSIGISVYPRDGEDEQTLMKNADMAMYFAKE
ncbi:MAG: diguanylate cyclase, partial [Syntrophaceae bacterium]|nr:diguanylate cyclase [Syntrophaceae bacterium]